MKNFILVLLSILFVSQTAFAIPERDYVNAPKTFEEYDTSHDRALAKKLHDDFYKKYPPKVTVDKEGNTHIEVTDPMGAYHEEVIRPYFDQCKDYPKTVYDFDDESDMSAYYPYGYTKKNNK